MKTIAAIALALGLVGFSSYAKDTANSYKQTLSAAPQAELPAVAARLVKDAKFRVREAATVDVVKAACAVNPAAAPLVVGAIARAVPEMAAVAAGTAAAEQPKQVEAITKAATAAAPARAGKIVAAVSGAVPGSYRTVAVAAAQAAPTAGKDILKSVGTSNPELKPYIDRELAGYGLSLPPVAVTLDQAATAQAKSIVAGPTPATTTLPTRGFNPGPPLVPPSATQSNAVPNADPTPGRNYARP